jgi:hypothetical protein
MIEVKLIRSPSPKHKFRVIFRTGRYVDFGGRGYSDYTLHKTPERMRLYVQRHGGKVPKVSKNIQRDMLRVETSRKELWTAAGVGTAGFWSRWLLWSHPSMGDAKKFISKKFKIKFTNS